LDVPPFVFTTTFSFLTRKTGQFTQHSIAKKSGPFLGTVYDDKLYLLHDIHPEFFDPETLIWSSWSKFKIPFRLRQLRLWQNKLDR
jgi:hypothetical protein